MWDNFSGWGGKITQAAAAAVQYALDDEEEAEKAHESKKESPEASLQVEVLFPFSTFCCVALLLLPVTASCH